MRRTVLLLLAVIALPLSAAEIPVTMLYYRISEAGIDPYLSRWLISDQFLRIDEGDAGDNFILYDRVADTVYSVVHNDRTVLEIPRRAVGKKPPKDLKQASRTVQDDNLPTVDGMRPTYRELLVNDTLCYSVVSVEGLLPEVVKIMAEYRLVMAGEHAKNLDNTPEELRQTCEMALHIFAPLMPLEKGLPIQEWDGQGKAQVLLDYKTELVSSGLFQLPEGYHHYQTLSDGNGIVK